MKKARYKFQYQDIYEQHYIPPNTKTQKDHNRHHTPGHNLSTKKQ